jgi:hypothetical protein
MVTSTPTTVPLAITSLTTSAQDFRLAAATSASAFNQSGNITVWSGLRPGGGNPGLCTYTSGLSFTVNNFLARIQGTDAGDQGAYDVALKAQATLTTAAADTVNTRWDLVGIKITDNGDGTSTSNVVIVTGAPAGSPADPNPGTNFLKIARLVVVANATNLSGVGGQGSIIDLRTWVTTAGGVTPVSNSSAYPTAGPAGSLFYDLATQAVGFWTGGANKLLRSTYLRLTRTDGNALATGSTPTQMTWATAADMNQDFGTYPSGAPTNFSLPSDGFWCAAFHISFDSNGTGIRRVHVKQGGTFHTKDQNAVIGDATHATALWPLNGHAGDVIGFYVDQNSGGNRTLSNQYAALFKLF